MNWTTQRLSVDLRSVMDLSLTLGHTGDTTLVRCLCGRFASRKGLLGRQNMDPAVDRPKFRHKRKPRLNFLVQSLLV
jgi:hypothetical protein